MTYKYRLKEISDTWQEHAYNQNFVSYNALGSGEYTFEVKAVDAKGNESEILSYTFSIALPYWQTWWFILVCVLVVALLVALVFLIRIRILTEQNKLLLEKQAVEKQLIESRQTALRSQMNPHFLFNALNSIQEMIMVNEKRMAGKYLGMFADLMRIYLNQSQEKTIKLSEEIEALDLYLDLEKVRFEDTLTINMDVDATLNIDFILIPPMIIQPYIENALKHGLLHKTNDRRLLINFKNDERGENLVCTIEDNGVGREESARINKNRNPNHKSFSTSATQKRLELLNHGKESPILVKFIDLKNDKGIGIGTQVILTIPSEKKGA